MQNIMKLILVGDSNVGKSSFMEMFLNNRFTSDAHFTIGVDYGSKQIIHNNNKTTIRIWDTAGQESYRSIVDIYFRNTQGALLLFNLTDRSTFHNAFNIWLPKLVDNSIPFILVGNKCDQKAVVSSEEIKYKCQEHNIIYIEASAKEDINVDQSFIKMISLIESLQLDQNNTQSIIPIRSTKKCCL